MKWLQESTRLFKSKKPEHFADHKHCKECAEHDETLKKASVKSIGMEQLGNPGWDPITFSTVEGKIYYMPALIRLCLETIESDDPYLCQFLSHLEWDGINNDLFIECNPDQRKFISDFIAFLMDKHIEEIVTNGCEDELLKVSEIWGKA